MFFKHRPRIDKLQKSGDRDGLLRALEHREVVVDRDNRAYDVGGYIRAAAAEALGGELDPEVVQALLDHLGDPDERVRASICRSLGRIGDRVASDPIARAAATWAPGEAQRAAVTALVELGAPSSARIYAGSLLENRSVESVGAAEEAAFTELAALAQPNDLGEAVARDLLPKCVDSPGAEAVFSLIVRWIGEPMVAPLLTRLGAPEVSSVAATALGSSRGAIAVEPLAGALSNPDPEVRRAAAWSLGEIRDPKAVEALLRAANDEDARVREEAGAALNKFGMVAVIVGIAGFMQRLLPAAAQGNGSAAAAELQAVAQIPAVLGAPPPPSQRLTLRERLRVAMTGSPRG